jgi:hypothetical protein
VLGDLDELFPTEFDILEQRADAEDRQCQARVDEFIFLGPFEWLVREVACVDFCHTVLGCRRNGPLYRALEELIRWGSLVITFERVCLICDRPSVWGSEGESPHSRAGRPFARYPDGYRARYR